MSAKFPRGGGGGGGSRTFFSSKSNGFLFMETLIDAATDINILLISLLCY